MRIIGSPVSDRTSALVGGVGGAGAGGVTTGWSTSGDATTGWTPCANADDETASTRCKGGTDGIIAAGSRGGRDHAASRARAAAPPGTSARRRGGVARAWARGAGRGDDSNGRRRANTRGAAGSWGSGTPREPPSAKATPHPKATRVGIV